MWGQKDLTSMKRWGSISSKIMEKIDTKRLKTVYNTSWWKIRLNLGLSIPGSKCDRDMPTFCAERGGQSDREKG